MNLDYPALAVDNFFEDPDEVRKWALSLPCVDENSERHYPGNRTESLYVVDETFFNATCMKIISSVYDIANMTANWKIEMYFQKTNPYHEDPNNILNKGWIHKDDQVDHFAGIVYLNPKADLGAGTSIFELKDGAEYNVKQQGRNNFYTTGITDGNGYAEKLIKHNSCFEETTRFNNKYNRLVMFDSDYYHGVNSLHTQDGEPRLTLVFFVRDFLGTSVVPKARRNYIKTPERIF